MIAAVGAAALKGAVGGVAISVGQLAARKARGALQGALGAKANVSTGLPGLATTTGAAIALALASTMIPRKHKGLAEFVVAGAFSEAVNFGLAMTPVAPYLGAFPPKPTLRVVDRKLGAYNARALSRGGGAGLGAFTRAMGVPANAGMGGTGY